MVKIPSGRSMSATFDTSARIASASPPRALDRVGGLEGRLLDAVPDPDRSFQRRAGAAAVPRLGASRHPTPRRV